MSEQYLGEQQVYLPRCVNVPQVLKITLYGAPGKVRLVRFWTWWGCEETALKICIDFDVWQGRMVIRPQRHIFMVYGGASLMMGPKSARKEWQERRSGILPLPS